MKKNQNVEKFNITVNGKVYDVVLSETGYMIDAEDHFIGWLFATVDDNGSVVWSSNSLSKELTADLGEAIESHFM